MLNKKDLEILNIINCMRKRGTNGSGDEPSAKNIAEKPLFVGSHLQKGLQIADCIAYCTSGILNNNPDFKKYESMIQPKFYGGAADSIRDMVLTYF